VTCGPDPLPEMFDGAVEFVAKEVFLVDGPSIVHVTDWLKRVMYLPAQHCRTYLSLRRSIKEECLGDVEEGIDDCIMHVGESGVELDASQWPTLLKAKDSAFVYVRLSRRPPTALSLQNDTSPDPTPSGTQDLIEYGDLSSDDDIPDHHQMALALRSDR
jgi:hypothetical protein